MTTVGATYSKGSVNFHQNGKVKAHLDKDCRVVGIEISEDVFTLNRIEKDIPIINKIDNPKCTKGLKKCEQEITIPKVRYVLVCHMESTNVVLDTVTINEDSFHTALKEKVTLLDDTPCASFKPIKAGGIKSFSCSECMYLSMCLDEQEVEIPILG